MMLPAAGIVRCLGVIVLLVSMARCDENDGSTCYQILQVSTAEGVHITDDRSETNCFIQANCIFVKAIASIPVSGLSTTWKITYGGCMPPEQCAQLDCKAMLEGQLQNIAEEVDIWNCTVSCCQGDLCNNDVDQTEEETAVAEGLDKGDENEDKEMFLENDEDSTNANQLVPKVNTTAAMTAAESKDGSTCLQILQASSGQGLSFVDERNETNCFLQTDCLLVKASVKINLPSPGLQEVPWTMTYGGCAAFGQCNQLDCKGLLSQALQSVPYDAEIVDCKAACCEGDLCNGDESILEDGGSSTIETPTPAGESETNNTISKAATTTTNPFSCGFTANVTDELQYFTSPYYPGNYPDNIRCAWIFYAPVGYQVRVNFLDIQIESCCDNIEISDEEGAVLIFVPGSADNTFIARANVLHIWFDTNRDTTFRGFNASYTIEGARLPSDTNDICLVEDELFLSAGETRYLQSPNYPSDYPLNKDCTVTIVAPPGYFLNITFEDSELQDFWDYVQVKNEDSEVPELNPTRFGNTLNGSTVYHSPGRKLSARFVSDNGVVKKGFKLVYTAVPEELRPPPVPDTRSTRTISVCSRRPVYAPQLIASISVSDVIKSPSGWASWISKYSGNLDCTVTIVAPHGHVLSISIEMMQTETCCDKLTITNTDPKVTEEFSRRYSGFILVGLPQVFTTPGRSVSVRFVTDDIIEYDGFRFSYRAIPDPKLQTTLAPTTTVPETTQPTTTTTTTTPTTQATTTVATTTPAPCGFNATASELPQTLNAPGEPERYQNDGRCEWFITARPGYVVNFTYTGFRGGWCCDSMEVYDGDLLLIKLKGRQGPESFLAWSGTLRLVYNVQNRFIRSTFQGFFIENSPPPTTPEPERTSPVTRNICALPPQVRVYTFSDKLQSPNFPGNYPNNQDCTVRLVAPPGYVVSFFILTVETEAWRQYGDFLTFRNADPDFSDDIIQQYSGHQTGWLFKSPGRKVDVQFKSDSRDSDRGFKFSYIATRDPNRPLPPSTTTRSTTTTPAPDSNRVTSSLPISPSVPATTPSITVTETTSNKPTTIPNEPAVQHYMLDDATMTYDTARQHCINNGADLCLKSDICVNNEPIIIGIQNGDQWTPVRDGYNDWVEVGNDNKSNGRGRVCYRHNEHYSAPPWGITAGSCPPWNKRKTCDIKGHLFCCRTSQLTPSSTAVTPTTITETTAQFSNTSEVITAPATVDICSDWSQLSADVRTTRYLESPNYPSHYPALTDCHISIFAPEGLAVRLEFEHFNTESCCDKLTLTDTDPQRTPAPPVDLSGYETGTLAYTTGHSTRIVFRSDGFTESTGFRIAYTAADRSVVPTTTTRGLTATTRGLTSTTRGLTSTTRGLTSTTRGLIATTRGLTDTPLSSACGFNANATSTSQNLNSPGFPEQYRSNLDCVWVLTSRPGYYVNFTISSFETESCCDYLKIRDGDQLLAKLKGASEPTTYTALSGSLHLRFISDRTVTSNGFQASFIETDPSSPTKMPQTTSAPCGFEAKATNLTRNIYSPGWPGSYPNSADCNWTLTARPGYQVQLDFQSFSTESCCDRLDITNNGKVQTFKGDTFSRRVLSINGRLELLFHSDGSVQHAGFEATFIEAFASTPPPPAPCGFKAQATDVSQELNSPRWPNRYENNLFCTWELTASEGKWIHVEFQSFSTESCCDTLMISANGTKVGIYKGSIQAQTIIIRNSLQLVFRTDSSSNGAGFQAEFFETDRPHQGAAPCGYTTFATENSQPFYSPGFPSQYGSGLDCEWSVSAQQGLKIRVTFPFGSFRTESCCDYLAVLDEVGNEMRRIQGEIDTVTPILSRTSRLVLRFHSDGSIPKRGFEATIQSVSSNFTENITAPVVTEVPIITTTSDGTCGFHSVTSAELQFITSPNYPDYYPEESDCRWHLQAPTNGSRIRIEITDLGTESCCDYVLILDNGVRISREAGSQANIQTYLSTSPRVEIRFYSDSSVQLRGFQLSYRTASANMTSILRPSPSTPVSTGEASTTSSESSCGFDAVASDRSQPLNSPGYPNAYMSRLNCEWRLTALDGRRIRVELTNFHTENCCDYLSVFDEHGNEIRKLRGDIGTVDPILSTTSRLVLRFNSDGSIAGSGFTATFRAVNMTSVSHTTQELSTAATKAPFELKQTTQESARNSTELKSSRINCAETLFAAPETQYFESPGYPHNYNINTDCSWTIYTPRSDQQIHVTFDVVDLACCDDILELFDGNEQVGTLINSQELSTRTQTGPESYLSSSDNLRIRLRTYGPNTSTGFRIQYQLSSASSNETTPEKRCYMGVIVSGGGSGLPQNAPTTTPCPAGSSCVDVRAQVSSPLGVKVSVAYGMCVPNIACASLTCEEIQRQIPSSAGVDLDDCSVRCCEEDLCNDPDAEPALISTSTATSEADDVAYDVGFTGYDDSNDAVFLPGCTYTEMYNEMSLCNTLIFNDYPYRTLTDCSTNFYLWERCAAGVNTRCLNGTKPSMLSFLPGSYNIFLEQIQNNMGNLSQILPMSAELLCEKDVNALSLFTNGISVAMLSLRQVASPNCQAQQVQSTLTRYFDQLRRVVFANDSKDFCRAYAEIIPIAEKFFTVCDFAELIVRYVPSTVEPNAKLIESLRKIFTLTPDLLHKTFVPKCLALETNEEMSPPPPSNFTAPTNFTTLYENECPLYHMDLMFLLDGSASIRGQEFQQLLKFVKDVASSFHLADTRIGVMQYSHYYSNRLSSQQPFMETEIQLGQCTNQTCFERAVDQIQHHGFTTFTAHAIQKAVEVDLANSDRFNDDCIRKIIVIITDGRSTDRRSLRNVTDEARDKGVILIPVGVRDFIAQELEIIAGNEKIYTASDFSNLEKVAGAVRDELINLLQSETPLTSPP
ncbi:CUB and sushi domain-containing protein 1-like isoform X3 [Clavelina lepadiformis]|uniref:CUB and sushi domain-containing protein 1-like isoform X3 n=1 Tax=Clavelina lepadiformis TaxID=159417 RepID=UPI004042CD82